ncbi:hypothetical protein [Marilutibacter chinensis]|uniref:Uncharacterized protein n=1 Tax=Marilutibacter chinensis TaxID=2912247 RepID=A0ABS9HWE9_9GAMM|nr:hypothetical protein [Lysobacter chinensis]MCF7222851.1 hypothetical protein [Lysobacter chinensis]
MLLKNGSTAPKLASLGHERLCGRRSLRCSAGFKSLKVKVKVKVKAKINGNGLAGQ